MQWLLSVVPICVFLITSDVGHLFHMRVGQVYIYFEEMSIQGPLPIFELGCLFFLFSSCKSSFIFLNMKPLFTSQVDVQFSTKKITKHTKKQKSMICSQEEKN